MLFLHFFCNLGFSSESEHGICLFFSYFVFLRFWIRIFFVFFLYFVFSRFWVCIFFVFCIFEILDSYFFGIFFVFFLGKKYKKKYKINTKKIRKNTPCTFVFFLYFSIAAKNTLCIFVFFLFFLILFQIALCLFVLWTFRQKTTRQVHQRMLYFLCSDDFVPFMVVFFL